MPNTRSIIQIDVADSAFDAFQEKFKSYLGELDKQQEKWEKAGSAMGLSGEALAGGALNAKDALAVAAAQAGVISEAIAKAVKAQNDLGGATKRSGDHMGKLHTAAKGVGGAISSIAGFIVKIAAFGGLGGLLGGLGISDLAGATLQRSRSAGRLNMSTGALASFGVHLQQFLGTGDLQNAVMAQNTVGGLGALSMLGINPQRAQGMNPGNLAIEELRAATKIYLGDKARGMQTPLSDPYLKNVFQGMLGGDIQSVLLAAQPGGLSELDKRQRGFNQDIAGNQIGKKQQDAWNNLAITLGAAGTKIQTLFIDKLSGLAGPIGKLTDAFVGFIGKILGSSGATYAIDTLSKNLDKFGTYLTDGQFQKDLQTTQKNFHDFSNELAVIVNHLRWLLPNAPPATESQKDVNTHKYLENQNPLASLGVDLGLKASNFFSGPHGVMAKKIMGIAANMMVDPITAAATAFLESGFNPRAQGDKNKKGGYDSSGLFQLNRYGEGAGMLLSQLFDPKTNTQTALSRFSYINKIGEKATENLFSKAVRSAATHVDSHGNPLGPNVSHAQISALFNTEGMRSAASQRPSDPYDYAIHINQIRAAMLRQLSHSPKPAQKTVPHTPVPTKIHIVNQTQARVVVQANAAAY
jgi:hypothetical protein